MGTPTPAESTLAMGGLAIIYLRGAYRGEEAHAVWKLYKGNKLNVVILVHRLFNFPGLKEAKEWCESNIFND